MFFYSEFANAIVTNTITKLVSNTATGSTEVAIPQLITMTIPSGSLTSSVNISISKLELTSPEVTTALSASELSASSYVFKFEPEGLTFSQPIMITIPIPSGSIAPAIYYTVSGSNTIYEQLPTTNDGNGNLVAYVTHFSNAFVGEANQIKSFWIATLGGFANEPAQYLVRTAVDSLNNVYMVASTTSQGSGGNDAFIAKYSADGNIQWQKTLGGTGNEEFYGISVDSSGNVYAIGVTSSQGAGNIDMLIVKYDTNGNLQWQKSLGGSGEDNGWGIACDSSGNVYICGYTLSQGAGNYDAFIAKYNSSGTIQWQRSLGGTNAEESYSIACDTSGNVYISGDVASQGAGGSDALIAKYNSSGVLQWQRSLGGSGADQADAIAVDSSGNVYISGQSNSQGAGLRDAFIAKYNSSGTIQWQRSLGGTGNEYAHSICVDSSGNVYIGGITTSQGLGNNDILVAKYDTAGTILWQRTFGGNKDDRAFGIAIDSTGALCVSGITTSAGSGNNDIIIIKLPSDGSLTGNYGNFTYKQSTLTDAARTLTDAARTLTDSARTLTDSAITLSDRSATLGTSLQPTHWIATLGGTGDDVGRLSAVDSDGNLYVTGYTTSQGAGLNDILLVKYDTKGTVLWQKILGGSGDDFGMGIAIDGSNNVYISGYTASSGADSQDVLIAKYNSDGVLQWQRTLGASNYEQSYGISVTTAGDVYVALVTASQGAGGEDAVIAKYDTNGNLLWQRSLGGSSNDIAFVCSADNNGNVYMAGRVSSQGAGSIDMLIAKYNSSGTLQWQRSLGGANNDSGFAITCDSSGNVYVAGDTASQGAGGVDMLLVKYNSSGVIQWQRSLGGASEERAYAVSCDASGNVYICGFSNSQGAGNYDIVVAKYNPSGIIQWQRVFGGIASDLGLGMALDPSGFIYLTGQTASTGAGSSDLIVVKLPIDGSRTGTYGSYTYSASTLTDSARTLTESARTLTESARTLTSATSSLTSATASLAQSRTTITSNLISKTQSLLSVPSFWINTLGDTGNEPVTYYSDVALDLSGNIYIASSTTSQGSGGNDVLVAKYDSTGIAQWQRTLGGSGAEEAHAIATDSVGNVYVVGQTTSQGAGSEDAFIAKYDTNGTIQWQKVFGGSSSDKAWGISIDLFDNLYVVGITLSQGAGSGDAFIAKYNSSGAIQWQRSLGGSLNDYAEGVCTDALGNVYVCGQVASQGAGGSDVLITKYNSSGGIQWQRSLGGSGYEEAYGIAADSSGNVYICGQVASQGAGSADILIAKYNSSGAIQWQRSLGGTGNDYGYRITVDSSGNVYIAGSTNSQGVGSYDAVIAKYDTAGTILWQRTLGGTGTEEAIGIATDATGAVCIAGYTTSAGAGSNDVFIAKLPADGSLTGSYGNFTYRAATLTDAARTLTSSARTLTDSARTLTSNTSTLTDKVATLKYGRTNIQ